ncbi:MAG: WYL domain-containing protein [Candidatus Nanopelagicales bacterium]|nr:WYL domain-containing protein [Candidatus Nanopelagicales bacterium]MCF8538919.1 WYL domain-containing protein [Candidatus Nanopelagicales bacterium]MCF8550699.1 WYL domain-containing protein [Candidatus Nanopelagicales bacterium]
MNRGKTERLLNLVFAMMAAGRAISREEIRQAVAGYDTDSSDEAFERMFERDKDELRSMGIPIETVSNAFEEVLGYRISHDSYGLINLDVTARELELLSIASSVWDHATLSAAANTALWKIESHSAMHAGESPLTGISRIRGSQAALVPLINAAREQKVVKFSYRSQTGDVQQRTVEPWRVICRRGNWYATGFDIERGDRRTFKLTRIRGQVKVTSSAAQHTEPENSTVAIDIPRDDLLETAIVDIAPGFGASLRKRADSVQSMENIDRITVSGHPDDLLSWILPSIAEIDSISPPDLQARVVDALCEVEGNHGN